MISIDESAGRRGPQVDRYRFGTRQLVEAVRTGRLTPVGAPGGSAWTPQQQALLFDSLENGWPVGPLVSWSPPRSAPPREVLLDGHRRVAALARLLPGPGVVLLRDLSVEAPRYLPAEQVLPGGRYLPVQAMLNTMDFLAAARMLELAEHSPEHNIALESSRRIHRAVFEFIQIRQPDPARVAELCRRLLPGRVEPVVLEQLATGA
jgi:hypothetical protein